MTLNRPLVKAWVMLGAALALSTLGALAPHALAVEALPQSPAPAPSFADLARKLEPAVVNISATRRVRVSGVEQLLFGLQGGSSPSTRRLHALGSGFILSPDGYIATNNHVISGAQDIQVKLQDGRVYPATIVGRDPELDVALLRAKGAKNLPAVRLGDSSAIRVGDWVVAVGNPYGLGHTVTAGIISAKDRTIGAGPYDDFLQTDAPINPGNSGGPLFNLSGQVVGINTAVARGQGLGFAIPINLARQSLTELRAQGKVTRGWVGIGVRDVPRPSNAPPGTRDPSGALVEQIVEDSPAAAAGLQKGDIVMALDGHLIQHSSDLTRMIGAERPGRTTRLTVKRGTRRLDVSVKLGDRAEAEAAVRKAHDREE
jgi:serine protease Do